MGLFGGGHRSKSLSHEQTKLHALRVQTSALGQPLVLQFGTARLPGKLLSNNDFTAIAHTTSESTGGKGGGSGTSTTSTTYTYTTASEIFLCVGSPKIAGIISLWDTKGNRKTLGKQLFNSTVPAVGPFTRQPTATGFLMDLGCGFVGSRSVTANDYGDDSYGHGGRSISIVGEITPLVRVASAPAAGQYSVDGTGTYTFNSADASKSIQIQYIKLTGTTSPLGQYGFTLFDGSQTAGWGYLTSKHPGQDLVHKLWAKVANSAIDCGESGQLPNFNFEVAGMLLYPGSLDSNPKDIINFITTDPVHGIAYPSANLDAMTLFSNWCVANGLLLSPTYDTQRPCGELIQELCDITNAAPFYSEGKLKVVPYGDQTVIGNGVTYTPPTAPIYDLTRDDFLCDPGAPPIEVIPASKQDAMNSMAVEYLSRANDYNPDILPDSDAAQIELYGLRKEDPVKWHPITSKTVAALALNMRLKRTTRELFGYRFRLGAQYELLEQMDLVTITLPELGFNKKPVRLTSKIENEDRSYDCEAEDFPYASASATLYPKGEGAGATTNTNNDPGDVATPFIYEPPVRATQDGLGNEIWVGAYGANPDWGGADIWLSNDNITYRRLNQSIPGKMRSGITASTLAAAADPDTTNTVDVDLSASGGSLVNATTTDCDNFRSMMLLNNELISFKDVALIGANQYRLGTRTRRGVYGTPIASHALSERAVRIDDNIVRLKFKAEDVGQTFYLKFTSYNTFGRATQQVANVTGYSFTLVGSSGGNDFIPTELVHDALVLQASATGAGTLLVQIAGTAYTIVAGDTLEYDIWIDPTSADFKAGVDIIFGDATKIRGNGYRDQVPLSADPSTDLSAYAKSQWFHRKIDLSRAAGKVTATWMVGFDGSSVGFHRAKFANIRIMNGKTVKAVGWVTGVPAFSFVNTNINYTIGTTPLYSQNDGGQWYAMLTAGTSSGMNKQGSIVPATGTSGPFGFYSSDAAIASQPSAVVTWIGVTQYRPDGTNFPVLSSATLYPWQADPPILTSVAGGAKAAATLFARCAYVKDGAIVGIGEASSFAIPLNNLLKVPSPVLTHPLAAVWSQTSFTDVAATLLENHTPTVGKKFLKLNAGTSLKVDGTGTKLVPGAASSLVQYVVQDHPWYDGYAVQMDVDLSPSAVGTDFFGILVGVRDSNNYYHIKTKGDGSLELEKKVAATVTSLQNNAGVGKTGTLKVVATQISASTTQIDVYWNGVLQFSKTDTSLPMPGAHGVRVGINSNSANLTVSADNFSVTDAAVPPALAVDGWVPLVGGAATTCSAQIDPRTPLALGTDWTEPATAGTHVAGLLNTWAGQNTTLESGAFASQFWTWNGGKAWLDKVGGAAIAYSASTVFYPTTDNNGSPPNFGSAAGPAQPATLALAAELFLDGKYPLCAASGVSFTTPAAGGSGSGSGGGGCSRKDMIVKPIGQNAFGVDFFNEDWIEVECENGCSKVATPRDRVLSYDHGVLELQDWLVREGLTLITELGKSAIKSVRRFKEAGIAVNLEMNEGHLYWAGKENGKGILSSNLKP